MNADMLDSPGTRVKNTLSVFVGEQESIRCLRDQMVVEPLDWTPTKLIIVAYQGEPLRGVVRAIGNGCYRIQYQDAVTGEWSFSVPKGRRKAKRESNVFRPCDVKIGDIVEFGGLELGGFLHPTIMWGNKEVVLCREEDVAGVIVADWSNGCPKCGGLEQLTDIAGTCRRCGDQENPLGLNG